MSASKGNMSPISTVLMVVLVVSVLLMIAIFWKKDAIEADLLQHTRKVLFQILPDAAAQVHSDGQDVIITAPPDEYAVLEKNIEQLKRINGVHDIHFVQSNEAMLPIEYDLDNADAHFENGLFVPKTKHPLEQIDLTQVRFKYGQTELTGEGLSALKQLAKSINQYPDIMVEVSTHTNNDGSPLGSLMLSSVRAKAIIRYLVADGVDEFRLVARGYGASRPITTNATLEGRQKNQRVAVTVLDN